MPPCPVGLQEVVLQGVSDIDVAEVLVACVATLRTPLLEPLLQHSI